MRNLIDSPASFKGIDIESLLETIDVQPTLENGEIVVHVSNFALISEKYREITVVNFNSLNQQELMKYIGSTIIKIIPQWIVSKIGKFSRRHIQKINIKILN